MRTDQERETGAGGRIVVRLRDGEILEGVAAAVDLDRPDLCLQVADPLSNNHEVVIPWASVKRLLLQRSELEDEPPAPALRKVAVHFWDGEVLKGYLDAEPLRQQHGMTLPLISPTFDEIEVFAIPFAAVKGLFVLKSWDSRAPEFEAETGHWLSGRAETPLLDLLGEIRVLSSHHVRGDIDKVEFERRRREVLDRI
jgi:hypothetical protein